MEQITIPKAWLERLLELSKKLDDKRDAGEDTFTELNMLLGYISSAETIIKMK